MTFPVALFTIEELLFLKRCLEGWLHNYQDGLHQYIVNPVSTLSQTLGHSHTLSKGRQRAPSRLLAAPGAAGDLTE